MEQTGTLVVLQVAGLSIYCSSSCCDAEGDKPQCAAPYLFIHQDFLPLVVLVFDSIKCSLLHPYWPFSLSYDVERPVNMVWNQNSCWWSLSLQPSPSAHHTKARITFISLTRIQATDTRVRPTKGFYGIKWLVRDHQTSAIIMYKKMISCTVMYMDLLQAKVQSTANNSQCMNWIQIILSGCVSMPSTYVWLKLVHTIFIFCIYSFI